MLPLVKAWIKNLTRDSNLLWCKLRSQCRVETYNSQWSGMLPADSSPRKASSVKYLHAHLLRPFLTHWLVSRKVKALHRLPENITALKVFPFTDILIKSIHTLAMSALKLIMPALSDYESINFPEQRNGSVIKRTVALQWSWVQILVPIWQLTTICDCSSQGSILPFSGLLSHCMVIHRQTCKQKPMYINMKKQLWKYFLWVSSIHYGFLFNYITCTLNFINCDALT